jgi:iron(III) transport system permease protein
MLLLPFKKLKNPWIAWTMIIAVFIVLPLVIIFISIFGQTGPNWHHILHNLLPSYVANTMMLMLSVALLTVITGVGTAWITSMYHFPGRRFFSWALILPIALPAYISGFTWAGILDFTSPVYIFARTHFGINTGQFLFFDLLSLPGATLILSLALYPYVYLITRAWFTRQSATMLEAALSLGKAPWQVFFEVALPLARPAIVAGVSLVMMEVLNDYGLVRYFGVDTFTIGVFTAWFAFSDPAAATRLSAYMMIFVLGLIYAERSQRGKMNFELQGSTFRPIIRRRTKPVKAAFMVLFCMIPFLFGFLFPALMLIYWAIKTAPAVMGYRFWELLGNSFMLAALAAMVVMLIAVVVAFTIRRFPSRLTRSLSGISTIGYALPGAVVAIGIIIPFILFDNVLTSLFGTLSGSIITGSWMLLIYAYMVRFMAVGFNSIESGMEKISHSLDEASLSLGKSTLSTLTSIQLPLLKGSITTAGLLVFIDVLKELPLTLILRPFNFDTLAIRAFEFASDERIAEAAPASLIIVLTGLIPVFILNRVMSKD